MRTKERQNQTQEKDENSKIQDDECEAVFPASKPLSVDLDRVKQTSFRSNQQLSGSSIIKIWFEAVDETGVRFSLDLANGLMFEPENWSPGIEMPGESAMDPEPLSVWGIDSQDARFNIIMHVDEFDSLYVDGELALKDDFSEVLGILSEVTNKKVRDIWIENPHEHEVS